MRVTIVPSANLVAVDGVAICDLDLSSIPSNVHAVQWYGTRGSVEVLAEDGVCIERNDEIISLDAYAELLAAFAERKQVLDAELAAVLESETIIEV